MVFVYESSELRLMEKREYSERKSNSRGNNLKTECVWIESRPNGRKRGGKPLF